MEIRVTIIARIKLVSVGHDTVAAVGINLGICQNVQNNNCYSSEFFKKYHK